MDGAAMRIAGLVLAAGLALSACTGANPDPEVSAGPTGDPTPTASASPSPSVPTKPERPDAMEREDAEGAAAAAEYFIELYPYVMATGDTEEFEAMSHRACGFCDGVLEDVAQFKESGQTYEGGDSKGTILVTYARDEVTGIYPFDMAIRQEGSVIIDGAGAVVSSADPSASEVRIEIGRRANSWVVVEIASVPK